MYLVVDLTVCGIALAVHRWYVLLLLIILLPLQMRGARAEREILQEQHLDGQAMIKHIISVWRAGFS
jgi:hypothetical protein